MNDASAHAPQPAATTFETFDLTVHLGPESTPWLSASSCAGFVHGVPRGGGALPDLQTLLDHVYDYADAVQFAEPDPAPELSRLLGDLVFGDPMVLQLFLATRGVAADHGKQTLVRILASPHLAVLPWELLPDPSAPAGGLGHRYLALAPDAHVVRMARGRSYPSRFTWLEPPLNLLIVLSSPTPQDEREDWLAFDIFEVKHNLLAELAPLQQAGLLNIDVEDRPTVENLRRRIGAQRRGYHLFHYVGHAMPDRLILEDRAGRREDMPSARLVELLRMCPDLRLALFAGCETARAAGDPAALDARTAVGWRDLLSLADYCVQEACPTVLGMQAVLPFATERVFTRFFYQAIVSGYTIAEALRLARGAIQSDDRLGGELLDWSVPALFTGSSEPGALLPRVTEPGVAPQRHRVDLKLGLQQRSGRFFGRDLPLRQAVDVLGGLTQDRVLVVTGQGGVGKTYLVDRALDELGEAVTHGLYIHLGRLAPAITAALDAIEEGGRVDLEALATMPPQEPVERMGRLADELLRLAGQRVRARDPAWSAAEWWERLVEDLVAHRLVLAIDDVGLIDRLENVLLRSIVTRWFAEIVRGHLHGKNPDQVLADLQWLLRELQELEERDGDAPELLKRGLDVLEETIARAPRRLQSRAPRLLRLITEEFVALAESSDVPVVDRLEDFAKQRSFGKDRRRVIDALVSLDRVRTGLGDALQVLADRRSQARIVVTADEVPRGLLGAPSDKVFEMRLAQLTWPETWRWIRRNLPGIVSYGEQYLSRLWARFGTRLEQWEELERRVIRSRGHQVDLEEMAAAIAPLPRVMTTPAQRPAHRPRNERALRIAVAGPHLSGPAALAEAMTRFAIDHGIGGRVVHGATGDGAVAALIDVPSPFRADGTTGERTIVQWLQSVSAQQPDIVLLDYGQEIPPAQVQQPRELVPERKLLRSLHYRCLLIAAGGNDTPTERVTAPSAYPEVLGVGSLDSSGQLRGYAEWRPALGKPDLFMEDDLSGTPLSIAIKPPTLAYHLGVDQWGSSFAALHAVATAAVVWAILPQLSPGGVREFLLEAAKPIGPAPAPLRLSAAEACYAARRRVILSTLEAGPCSRETLAAITGLELRMVAATLNGLVESDEVQRLASGRLERYELR
jgi:hypothetical protein